MRTLYYDCFAGISGDMHLGAMLDLGVPADYLTRELEKLHVPGYALRIRQDQRKGICGTRVNVDLYGKAAHGHRHGLSGMLRHLWSHLHPAHRVARAESKVHGKPLQEVHFHEVGALDSIVDIVGAAICIDYLKPDRILSSPVELGGGFVRCAHGKLPVPAPATLEIIRDIPTTRGVVPFEMTTPTGAAIIATVADAFTRTPECTFTRIGYGIGHRDTEIPNVLRVAWAETDEPVDGKADADSGCGAPDAAPSPSASQVWELSCNIDDMNPENYEFAAEKCVEAGALDVFLQPVYMKKMRPGILFSVLCSAENVEKIEEQIFTHTTTAGIRKHPVKRSVLQRKTRIESTPWGPVRIKDLYYRDRLLHSKPEYDDCVRIAREQHLTVDTVREACKK